MNVKIVRVTRYAIKKLSMGTASVAVALGFMFVQGQTPGHADTVGSNISRNNSKPVKRRKIRSKTPKQFIRLGCSSKPKQQLQLRLLQKTEETTAAAEKKEETTAGNRESRRKCSREKEETTVAEENKPRTSFKTQLLKVKHHSKRRHYRRRRCRCATSTPKVENLVSHQKFSRSIIKTSFMVNFGDKANWTGAETTADLPAFKWVLLIRKK